MERHKKKSQCSIDLFECNAREIWMEYGFLWQCPLGWLYYSGIWMESRLVGDLSMHRIWINQSVDHLLNYMFYALHVLLLYHHKIAKFHLMHALMVLDKNLLWFLFVFCVTTFFVRPHHKYNRLVCFPVHQKHWWSIKKWNIICLLDAKFVFN